VSDSKISKLKVCKIIENKFYFNKTFAADKFTKHFAETADINTRVDLVEVDFQLDLFADETCYKAAAAAQHSIVTG